MGAIVYGRRALRRFERETGEQIVHAVGPYLTTVDHRHLGWTGERWTELEPLDGHCGLPVRFSSCYELFGNGPGWQRQLMRGLCHDCGTASGALHRWDCDRLSRLMAWVNPDYWPRPVHRPRWMDDPRCPASRTALTLRLAVELDVPPELLIVGVGANHWDVWVRPGEEPRRRADWVAEQVLKDSGLDPARYRLGWEPSPFDFRTLEGP